jgi:hypothetical protein
MFSSVLSMKQFLRDCNGRHAALSPKIDISSLAGCQNLT